MKRTLILIAFLIVWVSNAQMISQGNSLINADVGIGSTTKISFSGMGMETKSKTVIPPVGVSYEYAVRDNITIGGFVAYSNQQVVSTITNQFDPSNETKITQDYKFIHLGALANYHFGLNLEKVDVYGGVKLGYLAFSSDVTTSGDSDIPSNLLQANVSSIIYGVQLGGRYFFTDHLAAHLVLGYGVSYVSFGLTYKIGY